MSQGDWLTVLSVLLIAGPWAAAGVAALWFIMRGRTEERDYR